MRSAHSELILLLLVGSVLSAVGCAEELGPERLTSTTVRGAVLVGGRPVGGGFVEFHPAPGTQGNLRVGPLATDGTFQLDRVAVGKVFVSLTQLRAGSIPSPRGPIDPRVFSINHANSVDRILLERTIPIDDPYSLPPIDLIQEAARHQQKRAGRRRKRSGRGPRLLERPARSSGMHRNTDPTDSGPASNLRQPDDPGHLSRRRGGDPPGLSRRSNRYCNRRSGGGPSGSMWRISTQRTTLKLKRCSVTPSTSTRSPLRMPSRIRTSRASTTGALTST